MQIRIHGNATEHLKIFLATIFCLYFCPPAMLQVHWPFKKLKIIKTLVTLKHNQP